MAQNDSVGSNRLLYSIIGVLGGTIAVGGLFIFGGTTSPSNKAKPAESPAVVVAQPAVPAATSPSSLAVESSDLSALALSIDRAIAANDFSYADSLLADANRRYVGNGTWPPLQQRLARARADYDTRMRQAEARRLIAEARGFAQVGDFADAEAMLQAADKQMPGFAETGQARGDIASMRTERGQLYRERYQYTAAIDQAFTADRLWEAERLLADYSQRFNQDDEYRARSNRLAEIRAAATWQARLNQSRSFIANARQAMDRGDFVEAERQLALADQAAPGFPDINQTRVDLSRRRIAAEQQQDGIRLILAAIDTAFQRRQYDDAERAIEDGRRRYGSYSGWADLQRRNASARQGNDQQANDFRAKNARALELVTLARRNTAQGDFVAADRALNEANAIFADLPEAAIARAELERAKADRARQDAEARAVAASVDAALARQQYADAEKMIGEGTKRFPSYAGWNELSRRLADGRREKPSQAGNAPMPAQVSPSQIFPAGPRPPAAGLPAASLPPPAPSAAAAPATNSQLATLVAATRDAIRRSDFATAEKTIAEADRIDGKAALELRAELTAERARQDGEIRTVAASADAAIAHQQYADAERLIIDGTRRYPSYAGWADLSRRLADARRTTPIQSGTAQVPGPPATANLPPATPAPNAAAATASPHLTQLLTTARDAIKRSDFSAAEKAVTEAERLDAKSASTKEMRAELNGAIDKSKTASASSPTAPPPREKAPPAVPAPAASQPDSRAVTPTPSTAPTATAPAAEPNKALAPALPLQLPQLVTKARDAIKRSDLVTAENAITEAEKVDAKADSVVKARAELNTALLSQYVLAARDAIKRSEFALAEENIARAEKLDAKAASVVEIREELKAAQAKTHDKMPPPTRK